MPEDVLFVMHEMAFAFLVWFAYLIFFVVLAALVLGAVQKGQEKQK